MAIGFHRGIHDDHRTEGEIVSEANRTPTDHDDGERADPPRRSTSLADLAARHWVATLAADPVSATLLGVHDHDDRLPDLSEEADAERRASSAALLVELERLEASELSDSEQGPDAVTAAMLRHSLERDIEQIDLRLVELSSDQMTGPHAELLMSAPQLTYPEPDQAEAALVRLEQIPNLLGQALDRFRAGAAAGRSPAAAVIARTLNTLDSYLATPVDSDPFLASGLPDDWPGEAAWHAEALSLVSERIRPAFRLFRSVIADELMPVARDDERAGWCWLPEGADLYGAVVAEHTTSHRAPRELHDLGRELCEEALPEEFRAIGPTALGVSDLESIFGALRDDPALRHRDEEEIVTVARGCIERAGSAIDGWFGHRPTSDCVVEPIPAMLAADAPYAYYYPPAVDGSRPGTYFINTADPEGSSRTEAESIAFHEAIPGHHLQIALAQELAGVPEFQRHDGPTAYIEGWALYTERLADEMGLYSGPLDRLGMLTADAWRSARLVVDTGLHALGWSRQRAIDYFARHTPVPTDQIPVEVDRYLAMPGQALSYKVGHLEIARQRVRAETDMGDRFDIVAFHDVVLGSGAVTLTVLDDLVGTWLSRG